MDFLSMIIQIIMAVVVSIIRIILIPIDALIQGAMPAVSSAFTAVGTFLATATTYLGWAISAVGIPWWIVSLVASYYIFRLTLPINIWIIKLALSWWHTLKP